MARQILVDTDPALLTAGLDLDDDLALLFLLGSPEVEVVGVTTTFGNTLGALSYRGALALLALAGRGSIPVARGADGPGDGETEASRFLVDAVRQRPGELTLLTLGPLTNLATALSAYPSLIGDLAGLVVMGGRAVDGLAEFNFRRDPAAAAAVLATRGRKVQIPFDLAFGVAVTPHDVARLAGPGRLIAPFVPKLARFARLQDRYRTWRGRAAGQAAGGFHPWDVVAAGYLVRPGLYVGVRSLEVSVDAGGRSFSRPALDEGLAFKVPGSVASALFLDLMLERVAIPVAD